MGYVFERSPGSLNQGMFSLHDKNAVITGGGSGIGKAIATIFASHGARVFLLDVNLPGAEEAAAAIARDGFIARALSCDVSEQAAVRKAVKLVMMEQPRIDILVNSAGVAHVGNLENTGEQDFDRIFKVNVKGVYNALAAVIGPMKKQGGGVILNLCSVAATVGISDRFSYSMSKGAVLSMTYSVAKDYLADNIRCNCISPGRVHTAFVDGFIKAHYPGKEKEMFEKLSRTQPIGRMAKPEEIGALALYLCSDEAAFITGTNYPIDGGFLTLNT